MAECAESAGRRFLPMMLDAGLFAGDAVGCYLQRVAVELHEGQLDAKVVYRKGACASGRGPYRRHWRFAASNFGQVVGDDRQMALF